MPNNLLQGDIKQAGVNTARFLINTTVGILGIFDPAASLGLNKKEKEDYGQTLGKWGVGPGCYVVLPILGPSTVRDTVGTVATFVGGDPWYNELQEMTLITLKKVIIMELELQVELILEQKI